MTLAFPVSVLQQKQRHLFFPESSMFFWHLSSAGKGDLGVAAPETFLTDILSQCLGKLQHGLVIYEKGGIFEWLICDNISASAYLCFSH